MDEKLTCPSCGTSLPIQAAEAGQLPAMLRLSELYRIGRGVERNDLESIQLKEKAAALLDSEEAE